MKRYTAKEASPTLLTYIIQSARLLAKRPTRTDEDASFTGTEARHVTNALTETSHTQPAVTFMLSKLPCLNPIRSLRKEMTNAWILTPPKNDDHCATCPARPHRYQRTECKIRKDYKLPTRYKKIRAT